MATTEGRGIAGDRMSPTSFLKHRESERIDGHRAPAQERSFFLQPVEQGVIIMRYKVRALGAFRAR